ncbi:hypothetical protein DO72_5594 [Burkholderia pseudomallei]|nr:hypothetical protein DO72_5594 [Burkholderia pseudomallei]
MGISAAIAAARVAAAATNVEEKRCFASPAGPLRSQHAERRRAAARAAFTSNARRVSRDDRLRGRLGVQDVISRASDPGCQIQGISIAPKLSRVRRPVRSGLAATGLESTARPVAPRARLEPRARSTASRAPHRPVAPLQLAPPPVGPLRVEHPAMAPRCSPASPRLRSSARRLAPATHEPPSTARHLAFP